jgi:hypothetical protein
MLEVRNRVLWFNFNPFKRSLTVFTTYVNKQFLISPIECVLIIFQYAINRLVFVMDEVRFLISS